MMCAKILLPAKYLRLLKNCVCYPQNTLRVVATRVVRLAGRKVTALVANDSLYFAETEKCKKCGKDNNNRNVR